MRRTLVEPQKNALPTQSLLHDSKKENQESKTKNVGNRNDKANFWIRARSVWMTGEQHMWQKTFPHRRTEDSRISISRGEELSHIIV